MTDLTAQKTGNIIRRTKLSYMTLATAVEACCGVAACLAIVTTLRLIVVGRWSGVENHSLIVWQTIV